MSELEERLRTLPWQQAREAVEVKLIEETGQVYVLAKSVDRVNKERAMRRRQLNGPWKRLHEFKEMDLSRDALLMKLGAARQQAPKGWRLVKVKVPRGKNKTGFEFTLRKAKLREVRRREGRYLLCDAT